MVLLVVLLVSVSVQGALGGPITPDDSFKPACGGAPKPQTRAMETLVPEKHLGEAGCTGGWPEEGANVTIACGQAVIVDVPSIDVTVLSVLGSLMFKDAKSLPRITLTAAFVIVEGRFSIGTRAKQYSQKARIVLKANPNGRRVVWYTSRPRSG